MNWSKKLKRWLEQIDRVKIKEPKRYSIPWDDGEVIYIKSDSPGHLYEELLKWNKDKKRKDWLICVEVTYDTSHRRKLL